MRPKKLYLISSVPEFKELEVSTVKNYLSSQNDIVIYDHARTSGFGFTKFSKHWRVVITRARYDLLQLMNRTALEPALSSCIPLQNMIALLEKNQLISDWNLPKPKDRSDIFVTEIKIAATRATAAEPRIEAAKTACAKKMKETNVEKEAKFVDGKTRSTFDQDLKQKLSEPSEHDAEAQDQDSNDDIRKANQNNETLNWNGVVETWSMDGKSSLFVPTVSELKRL